MLVSRPRTCVVCGAPAYFKRAGRPRTLADLARHNCLVTSTEDGVADSWHFQDGGKALWVKVGGMLQCNDGEVLVSAICKEGPATLQGTGAKCSPAGGAGLCMRK